MSGNDFLNRGAFGLIGEFRLQDEEGAHLDAVGHAGVELAHILERHVIPALGFGIGEGITADDAKLGMG